MLTQSILNKNNPLLAIYNSASNDDAGNSTASAAIVNTITDHHPPSKDINTAATQLTRQANDFKQQQDHDDLLQHIHERVCVRFYFCF